MATYDGVLFDPPAPVATVSVRNSVSGDAVADVPLLIDTGADATLLPETVAEALGLLRERSALYELVGFNDSVTLSPAVRPDLLFLGRTFTGLFLLTPNPCGIMGRNVLNHLALVLDGPSSRWEELPKSLTS